MAATVAKPGDPRGSEVGPQSMAEGLGLGFRVEGRVQ